MISLPLPLLLRDFRAQFRGYRAGVLISIYTLLILLATMWVYHMVTGQMDFSAPLVSSQIGQALFVGLALSIQALTVFLAPVITLDAISSEHEGGTLTVLLLTPLSVSQILMSKLVTAMAFVVVLLCSTLPLFSLVILFGGVPLVNVAEVSTTIFLTAMMGGIVGLFCSSLTRHTHIATLLCYALLIVVVGGTIFAANFWNITHAGTTPPAYVVSNPLSAITTTLTTTYETPDYVTPSTLSPHVILKLFSIGTTRQEESIPLHRATWVLYGGIGLLLLWINVHLLQPGGRWRMGRADRIIAELVAIYLAFAWVVRDWWLQGL